MELAYKRDVKTATKIETKKYNGTEIKQFAIQQRFYVCVIQTLLIQYVCLSFRFASHPIELFVIVAVAFVVPNAFVMPTK